MSLASAVFGPAALDGGAMAHRPTAAQLTEIRRGIDQLLPKGAAVCLLYILSLQDTSAGEAELGAMAGLETEIFGARLCNRALLVIPRTESMELGPEAEQAYIDSANARVLEALSKVEGGRLVFDPRPQGEAEQSGANCAPSPDVLELISRASSVAGALSSASDIRRQQQKQAAAGVPGGRKAARRARQLEAGLISQKQLYGADADPVASALPVSASAAERNACVVS